MPRGAALAPAEAAQLDRVLAVVDRVLGERVVAAALHGSGASLGGLRVDSDLDVLVVVRDPLRPADASALVAGLLPISGRRATEVVGRPVELTIVALADIVPWRFPPRRQLQYGEWLRDELARGNIRPPAEDPDLAILLRQALDEHRMLRGRELGVTLEPVPAADVRRAIELSLPSLLDDLVGDERNVLLTLARMWATRETGAILPKDRAADWAIDRLADAPRVAAVLAEARDAYLGRSRDDWTRRAAEMMAAAELLAGRVCAEDGGWIEPRGD